MRRTISTLFAGLAVLATIIASLFTKSNVATGVAIIPTLAGIWMWWVIGRNWSTWGYVERAEDLLVVHGALFRKLVVVPYGRMQLVDVEVGPVERAFGLVTVRLHTAAATTDARICGLPPEDAAVLRDRLAALGESRAAGL